MSSFVLFSILRNLFYLILRLKIRNICGDETVWEV